MNTYYSSYMLAERIKPETHFRICIVCRILVRRIHINVKNNTENVTIYC